MGDWNIEELADLIQQLREIAGTLKEKGGGIEAVSRNTDALITDIEMLEMNISDLKGLV